MIFSAFYQRKGRFKCYIGLYIAALTFKLFVDFEGFLQIIPRIPTEDNKIRFPDRRYHEKKFSFNRLKISFLTNDIQEIFELSSDKTSRIQKCPFKNTLFPRAS